MNPKCSDWISEPSMYAFFDNPAYINVWGTTDQRACIPKIAQNSDFYVPLSNVAKNAHISWFYLGAFSNASSKCVLEDFAI